MMDDPSVTTEAAIENRLVGNGISLSDERLCEVIEELHYVDLLIVSHFREKVIRTLAEAGLRITLYGTGWENCDWLKNCPTVDFKGRVSAYQIVELMQDSKIVLSTMTWFKDGTHDRVFNGMLAGAVAVTDCSAYMRENFIGYDFAGNADEAELVMFELTEVESISSRLRTLLSNMDIMQRIADNGREKAAHYHTWQYRADEIDANILKYL